MSVKCVLVTIKGFVFPTKRHWKIELTGVLGKQAISLFNQAPTFKSMCKSHFEIEGFTAYDKAPNKAQQKSFSDVTNLHDMAATLQ